MALLRTNVSEEHIASIIMVTKFRELGTKLRVTSSPSLLATANVGCSLPILATLILEAIYSSETSVLTRGRRRHIPEHGILLSHRRENLKSYICG
jgi:hypothetical protein